MDSKHNVIPWVIVLAAVQGTAAQECFDRGNKKYSLTWSAQGSTFFDDWDYGEHDYTNGAVRYVGREEAHNESLTKAFDTHAIVRPGIVETDKDGSHPRRKSIRLSTQKNWRYFLAAMKYSHTPFGCGVWPAFWTNGADGNWPTSGELDILEYWNYAKSEVSFHTAVSEEDGCKLDAAQLRKKGCPHFRDVNNGMMPWYANNCQTNYDLFPPRLGCAPTTDQKEPVRPLMTGEEYSNNPGVIAAEWTKEFIKVFYIPEALIPKDLESGNPQPDTWDKFIISYYPFAASEQAHPGSCNLTGKGVSSPQSFVLNIELCGGRGSLEFPMSGCGASHLKCRNKNYAGSGDCCTQYMTDDSKSSEALAKNAFFNISYIKVWQEAGARTDSEIVV